MGREGSDSVRAAQEEKMHPSTFEYLKPTDESIAPMLECGKPPKTFCEVLETNFLIAETRPYLSNRFNAMREI